MIFHPINNFEKINEWNDCRWFIENQQFIKKLIIFIKKKIKNLFIVKKTIEICKLISLNVSK